MKCRRCGAENAVHMRDCGNCGTPLSSLDYGNREAEEASPSVSHAAGENAVNMPQPLLVGANQDLSKTPQLVSLGLSVFMLVVGVADLSMSLLYGDGLSISSVFIIAPAALVLFIVFFSRRRGSKTARYVWQRGDMLAPMAGSRGTGISGVLVIPLVMVASIIMGALLFSEAPILIPVLVGLLISTALLVGLIRSRVMIQRDSVIVGIPNGPIMLRIPFKETHSIRLRGRLLRITMTERISPLTSKTFRYLILGDPRPVAAAIQAVGLTQGMDAIVENIEVDPVFLRTCMMAIQHEDDNVRNRPRDSRAIESSLLAPERSHSPEIISVLLALAGIAAVATGLVLTLLDRVVAEEIGRHLPYIECCAILEFLFGAVMIAGAVMARRRKRYGLVKASAIVAIIGFGGLLSTILGIVSLILLMRSADEFER